jgi:hypothetical protein
MRRARCRGKSELFWKTIPGDGSKYKDREVYIILALQVCEVCPVVDECLEYGQKTRAQGVYGGRYFKGQGDRHRRQVV